MTTNEADPNVRLSESRMALLAKRLKAGRGSPANAAGQIPRRTERRRAPLSFAQQRLWVLERLSPGLPIYNLTQALRLVGQLDEAALQRAFDELVRRHESLRTSFAEEQGVPVQVIHDPEPVSWHLEDLTGLPESECEERSGRLIELEAETPFDLSSDRLLRVRLIRLLDNEHILLLTIHHIVSDGWSTSVLYRELISLYESYLGGRPPALPELPIQYQDFAEWQRGWLQGERLEALLAFWRQRLAGSPVLELLCDHPRPALQTYRGSKVLVPLSPELYRKLINFSRKHSATLFMTMLAALDVLLSRLTGQEDVVVGSAIANRNRAQIEPLIGFFVNMLVMRTQVAGNACFEELLAAVREQAFQAFEHQDLPFERLVDELDVERDLARNPLFQVAFAVQNVPRLALKVPGMIFKPIRPTVKSTRFDLEVHVWEGAEQAMIQAVYASDLFESSTIARLLQSYLLLLEHLIENPGQRLEEVSVLEQGERRRLLEQWSGSRTEYGREVTIARRFAQVAGRDPQAVALEYGDRTLSYGELDRRANRLAQHLVGLGVGPDVRVGVFAHRGIELLVGLVAIMKAGGAYVPLDPEYPQERLGFMIEDAQAPVILSQADLAGRLPAGTAVVDLGQVWEPMGAESQQAPQSRGKAQDLAYMMYTSGSTGRPKGVMVTQRAVMRLVVGTDYVQLGPGDRVAQVSSSSFDAATFEIWGALLNGAALVGIGKYVSLSVEEFARELRQRRVNVLFLTTALFNQVVREAPGAFEGIRDLMFGGEACDPQCVRDLLGNRPPRRLLHVYGPTENTTYSTWHLVREVPEGAVTVPIGGPIANSTVYVLDRAGQPVPVGVPGELYVGGDGVARGYWRQPELTAERFVPDAFGTEPGGKLYRTGDLVRWREDGALEFLGRKDQQVKIRGYRIELGEIETVLREHAKLAEAVVVAREEGGLKRLVAYVVAKDGQREEELVPELRGHLKQRLPEYMVPAVFMLLQALPLNANGKVDRGALPAPGGERYAAARFTPPRSLKERLLAEIWRGVLNVERVGINDNFFELGGDSIISIQVVARAKSRGLRLTPRQLFQHQTVAELAAVAEEHGGQQEGQEPVRGVVELTPVQRWFFEADGVEPQHFNQAFFLQLSEAVEEARLGQALSKVVEHHDSFRLRYRREEGEWVQEYAEAPGPLRLERGSVPPGLQRAAAGQWLAEAAGRVQAALDLGRGPLTALALYTTEDGQRLLLWVIHHLIVDGVSWRILLEDLNRAYDQLARGAEVQLPPAGSSFQRWAEGLKRWAGGEQAQREGAYWQERRWEQAVLELPVELEGGENTEASARTVVAELEEQLTRQLLMQVPAAYNTQINDVLLTALVRVLQGWTGRAAVALVLEGHGREAVGQQPLDIGRTVGWFTSVFPLLLELEAGAGVGEGLKAVKEQLRRVPAGGLAYGVSRYLSGKQELAGSLARLEPQISFNYLGQFDPVQRNSPWFSWAPFSAGAAVSPRRRRRHLLEINAIVVEGRLRVSWGYSTNRHRTSTVQGLSEAFVEQLRVIIRHCVQPEAGGYTPSDFPEAKLDQQALDQLVTELDHDA